MSAQTQTAPTLKPQSAPPRKKSVAGRIVGFFSKGVVNFVLLLVAVFWLILTVGLLLMSLRTLGDHDSSGWWTFLTKSEELCLDKYAIMLSLQTSICLF